MENPKVLQKNKYYFMYEYGCSYIFLRCVDLVLSRKKALHLFGVLRSL